MKKLFAILLSLVLIMACAGLAETAPKTQMGRVEMGGGFVLQCALPQGYVLNPIEEDSGRYLGTIESPDAGKPLMYLSIAFDELLSDVDRLNDLDDAALAAIEATFTSEDSVEISYMETAYGTRLMVVRETANNDYVDFYTVYKGYEVEIVMTLSPDAPEGTVLNDDMIAMAVDFLSDLDFVPAQ